MARYVPTTLVFLLLTCLGAARAQPMDAANDLAAPPSGSAESPPPPSLDRSPPLWPVLPSVLFPEVSARLDADGPRIEPEQAWRPQKLQTEGPLGQWTSQIVWIDPQAQREALLLQSSWKTDQAWNMDVLGPLFLFGQLGAAPDPVAAEALKMNGRTGVGCKIPVPLGIEVQVRGGPALTYTDPLGADRGGERSQVFLEVQCRCPLPGKMGLEYQGAAVPGLGPQERDRISQDFRFALPVGDVGKLQLGAKHLWESAPSSRQGTDSMEVYIGFELGQWSKK